MIFKNSLKIAPVFRWVDYCKNFFKYYKLCKSILLLEFYIILLLPFIAKFIVTERITTMHVNLHYCMMQIKSLR